jgi:hypothetical protein
MPAGEAEPIDEWGLVPEDVQDRNDSIQLASGLVEPCRSIPKIPASPRSSVGGQWILPSVAADWRYAD